MSSPNQVIEEDSASEFDTSKTGFDAIRGWFIKSYNGNLSFSFALNVFKLPINYPQVVMEYLKTIASQ